jgi:hypothetical protein
LRVYFTTWFAQKFTEQEFLMYGKKPSWKEMIKWAFRKIEKMNNCDFIKKAFQ